MTKADTRRCYYDHEPAWRRIAGAGGTGWDDILADDEPGSYVGIDELLRSPHCPAAGLAVDLGCGGGQVVVRLARRGFQVIGLDYAETAIGVARANLQAAGLQATLRVADCTQPLELPGEASLIVDNHVLHCLVEPADRQAFLDNVRTHLAPEGLLFSEVMSSEGTFDAARYEVEPKTGINERGTRIWVTRDRLRRELEEAGLEVVDQHLRDEDPADASGALIVTLARRR